MIDDSHRLATVKTSHRAAVTKKSCNVQCHGVKCWSVIVIDRTYNVAITLQHVSITLSVIPPLYLYIHIWVKQIVDYARFHYVERICAMHVGNASHVG